VKQQLPTVVITTERFDTVAKVTLRSQRVPESIVVEIKGNPEFVSDQELERQSQEMVDTLVTRLTAEHKN
jgi:hypothetical protein